jgi:predicted dehydrogenase
MHQLSNASQWNRRRWLRASAAATLAVHTSSTPQTGFSSPLGRPRIAVVGCGSRWGWQLANGGSYGVGPDFAKFADYVGVCDVDRQRVDAAAGLVRSWSGTTPAKTIDYRDLIERDDIDAIVVFTPDHWHAKVAIEAMHSGKDVYCEKPMTLTIEEGQRICDTVRKTKRVFQVGTQQRSDPKFVQAVAMIREGRIGKLRRVECGIGGAPASPAIPTAPIPKSLDWDRWLGPVAEVDYRRLAGAKNETGAWSNNHYEFRWWYEFSGGKLTDWGAHHVDIATWAIDRKDGAALTIEPKMVEHPVDFRAGEPVQRDRYNTATRFHFVVSDEEGVELEILSNARNGILFEGDEGKIFVNRGTLAGQAVDELKQKPLPEGAVNRVFKGKTVLDKVERFDSLAHVQNFFECMADRSETISDVFSHHRGLTTCHLAGISGRLDRKIHWDSKQEVITGDAEAAAMISRVKRTGFEI